MLCCAPADAAGSGLPYYCEDSRIERATLCARGCADRYSAAPRSVRALFLALQCAEFHSLPDLVNLALTFEQSDTLARGRASNMVNELHQYTLSKRSMVRVLTVPM